MSLSSRSSISSFGNHERLGRGVERHRLVVLGRNDAGDDAAVHRRDDRRLVVLGDRRRSGRRCSTSRYSRSARFEPVRSGPILAPAPYSVWHCWQVLANTARPNSASGGVGGLGQRVCDSWRSAPLCRPACCGPCPRSSPAARRSSSFVQDCAAAAPGRPTDRPSAICPLGDRLQAARRRTRPAT